MYPKENRSFWCPNIRDITISVQNTNIILKYINISLILYKQNASCFYTKKRKLFFRVKICQKLPKKNVKDYFEEYFSINYYLKKIALTKYQYWKWILSFVSNDVFCMRKYFTYMRKYFKISIQSWFNILHNITFLTLRMITIMQSLSIMAIEILDIQS